MSRIFSRALKLLTNSVQTTQLLRPSGRPLKELSERDLIQLESEVGSQLFGPVSKGHRREFFHDEKGHWVWHEEWIDSLGNTQAITTRYEVQAKGVLKVRIGEPYTYIDGEELVNLTCAAGMYHEQVARKIYKREPKDLTSTN